MASHWTDPLNELSLAFGRFELSLRTGELQSGGVTVELAALPTRVLLYLAANRRRVVPKRELAKEIWGATEVSEATMQQAVRAARVAVGDDGRAQRLIRTASGIGYRFVAPVRGDSEVTPSAPHHDIPLVGRRSQLDTFERSLARLRASRGSLLLFSGEAGIGKSRLVEELAVMAARRGLAVLSGGERAPGGASPFWPWIDVFSGLSAIRPVDELRTQVPYLLGLGGDEAVRATEPERFKHFALAAQCLRRAADLGPLLILLEDIHLAGTYSWEFLETVARTSLHASLLVVATHRPLENTPDPDPSRIRNRISKLDRVSESEIDCLSDVESAYLVELVSSRALPAPHVSTISNGTGGNPFFAVEFARLLPKSAEPLDQNDWKDFIGESITRLVEIRLARLSGDVRSILVQAAAIGTTFEASILQRVLGGTDPRQALAGGMEERIVSELRTGSGVYRFAHALIHDAFYSELGADSDGCRRTHLRIADAIETIDPTKHSELAHHVCAAAEMAGPTRIARATERAARSAAQGGEINAGFAYYEDALAALARCVPLDPEIHCQMCVEAGELGIRSSKPEIARAILDGAIETSRQLGRSDLFARASLGRTFRTEIVGTADPFVIALLEEAIAGLGTALPGIAAQLRSRLGIELRYSTDRADQALALVERAIGEAEASGDDRSLARVLEDASLVYWSLADPSYWLGLNRRIEQVARSVGDSELAFQGCKGIATAHLELCQRADFNREVERCATEADLYPSPFLQAVVAGLRASQAFLDGDFARAEALVLQSTSHGLNELAPLSAGQIFYHRLETGRLSELEAPTRDFMQASPGVVTWRAALARLLADDRRYAEAREVLAELPPLNQIAKDRNWFIALAILSECAISLDDHDLALQLFGQIEPFAEVGAVLGNGTMFYGSGAHHLGSLSILFQRLDDAHRFLEQAWTLHTSLGSGTWQLRTQVQQARLLAARGENRGAAELAARVAQRATELGMLRCAEAAQQIVLTAR